MVRDIKLGQSVVFDVSTLLRGKSSEHYTMVLIYQMESTDPVYVIFVGVWSPGDVSSKGGGVLI